MKQLIFALLLAISLSSMAQNGGQFPENGSVKLEYAGGGKVKVYNKQSCEAIIKVDDGITSVDLTVPATSFVLFTISNGLTANFTVKAKTTTNCGGTDFGMVELYIANLPLKFVSFNTTRISNTEFWVNFEIAEAVNVKQFNIKASVDAKVYRTITILFPDEIQPNRKYSVKVNLANK
jgi:hypothetical protein